MSRMARLIFACEAYDLANTAMCDGETGKLPRVLISPDKGLTPRVQLEGLSFPRGGLAYLHSRGRRRMAGLLSSERPPMAQAAPRCTKSWCGQIATRLDRIACAPAGIRRRADKAECAVESR